MSVRVLYRQMAPGIDLLQGSRHRTGCSPVLVRPTLFCLTGNPPFLDLHFVRHRRPSLPGARPTLGPRFVNGASRCCLGRAGFGRSRYLSPFTVPLYTPIHSPTHRTYICGPSFELMGDTFHSLQLLNCLENHEGPGALSNSQDFPLIEAGWRSNDAEAPTWQQWEAAARKYHQHVPDL